MNDTIAEALKDVAGGVTDVNPGQIKNISDIAIRQLQLQARGAELEALVKSNNEELRKVSEFELPNAMAEAGMKSFELQDGSKIGVERVFTASVKVEYRSDAFMWMRERGHDSLIKTEVKVPLGKGASDEAQKILAVLKEHFPEFNGELDESVHWATLRAFVKEQIEAEELAVNSGENVDDPLPRELLGVYIIDKAKITPPKKKKDK